MAPPGASVAGVDPRAGLRADCSRCTGLCCVALTFVRSTDFAVDKAAGDPCVNLQADYRCGIHERLRTSGYRGCTVFDCYGAGQKVTQVTFGGSSWRDDETTRRDMFAVFPVVRQLQERLWYLTIAREYAARSASDAGSQCAAVDAVLAETQRLTLADAVTILAVNLDDHRASVNRVIGPVSETVRASYRATVPGSLPRRVGPGADLMGATLARADLSGADLRGAYLIAADLRGATLAGADLIGADLRDAELAGADLASALFLTQMQINSARGDAHTRLPIGLDRPPHWAGNR